MHAECSVQASALPVRQCSRQTPPSRPPRQRTPTRPPTTPPCCISAAWLPWQAVKDPADVAEALVRLWPWIEAALGELAGGGGRAGGAGLHGECDFFFKQKCCGTLLPARPAADLPPASFPSAACWQTGLPASRRR